MRFFNTRGPVVEADHYCVPPLQRLNLGNILRLVRQKHYFVLHAPRQSGKTTVLFALRDRLNRGEDGNFRCAYTSFAPGLAAGEDRGQAAQAILGMLGRQARTTLADGFVDEVWPDILSKFGPDAAILEVLSRWAESNPKPLVLLIDEADALSGPTLASMLQQLREGYNQRPGAFPQSLALCGLRNMRDYRVGETSPFNIAESMRLGDFSRDEVASLLRQHTEETGQTFASKALEAVWTQTRGQPWLVNALAYEVCFPAVADWQHDSALRRPKQSTIRVIEAQDIVEARERLIARRDTHLDNLAHRLADERTHRVIAPILTGDDSGAGYSREDLQYVRDLGLVASDDPLRLANPIYAEVVPRTLNHVVHGALATRDTAWFVDPDGGLNVSKLLAEFQAFFPEHSEHWRGRFEVAEAWPQLLLQAFLQRAVNHRGRVEREYATGGRRTDLTLIWPPPDGAKGREHKHVVECKLRRGNLEKLVAKAVEQTADYMDACAAATGHLVIIDTNQGHRWTERATHRIETAPSGEVVEVWCM